MTSIRVRTICTAVVALAAGFIAIAHVYLSNSGRDVNIKVILQNTLIQCRASYGDKLPGNASISWRARLEIDDWAQYRNGTIPTNPYDMPSRFSYPAQITPLVNSFGNVFAVKYPSPPSLHESGKGVPLFVLIEGVSIPVFANVDFTPYDIQQYINHGFRVTAIDAHKTVWILTLDDCHKASGIVHIATGSEGAQLFSSRGGPGWPLWAYLGALAQEGLVGRTYDSRNLLSTIAYAGGTIDTRTYDAGGRLSSETLGNGQVVTRAYLTGDNLPAGWPRLAALGLPGCLGTRGAGRADV